MKKKRRNEANQNIYAITCDICEANAFKVL